MVRCGSFPLLFKRRKGYNLSINKINKKFMVKKVLVCFFALCVLILPAFVSAGNATVSVSTKAIAPTVGYSEEELVALIAKLQKQLEELRKNQIQCSLADVDLSIGDGEDDGLKEYVKSLQSLLKEKGYFTAGVTGYFGKITRTAVYSFQKNLGLNQTGMADAALRAKVRELKCKKDYSAWASDKTTKVEKTENKTETKTSVVSSIKLSGSGSSVSWVTSGVSKNGFKIVWSKNSGPTYPLRSGDQYQYLTDPNANSTTLTAFNGVGTYYVRVCEYLGGACGTYSNEVVLSL